MKSPDRGQHRDVVARIAVSIARSIGVEAAFRARFSIDNAVHPGPPSSLTPEDLGAVYETLQQPERAADFRRLIGGEARHSALEALPTTQRFTPPWIARWMVDEALRACSGSTLPCLDPACGGGQLLIALFDALCARGEDPGGLLAHHIVGFDIDPVAAEVASWSLWLHASRETGREDLAAPQVFAPPLPHGALDDVHSLSAATDGVVVPAGFRVVVANPPYMGARHLSPEVRAHLREHFGPFAGDLYTAFLKRCSDLTAPGGGLGILCQQSFLFLKRDRALRRDLFAEIGPRRWLHLGAHAFPRLTGEKASVVAFSATRGEITAGADVSVVDLTDLRTPDAKAEAYRAPEERRRRTYSAEFGQSRAAAGGPFTYWWPASLRHVFDAPHTLGDFVDVPGSPNKTADNKRFLRYFWEIDPRVEAEGQRWVPYAKGGSHQRWYGNLERVVDGSSAARRYYADNKTSNLLAEAYWFREGITWSDFGGTAFSARWLPPHGAFDMAGPALFPRDHDELDLLFWLGFLNARLVCHLLNADNPTIHYQVSNLRRLPLPPEERLLNPDSVQSIRAAAEAARAVTLELARSNPLDPTYETPALLQVMPEGFATATDWAVAAEQLRAAARARVSTHQTVIDLAVQRLYGATDQHVLSLDRRQRWPKVKATAAARHLAAARLFVGLVAHGYRRHPDVEAGPIDTVGEALMGTAGWRLLRAASGYDLDAMTRDTRLLYRGQPYWLLERVNTR